MDLEMADRPAREPLGDLHLYTFDRPVTVADRGSKQVALFAAAVGKDRRDAGGILLDPRQDAA